MTIKQKFILLFVVITVTICTGAFFFYRAQVVQDKAKVTLNLAGRQRMLSQKYTKEYVNTLIPLQVRNSTLKTAEVATLQIVEDRKQYTKNIEGPSHSIIVTDW